MTIEGVIVRGVGGFYDVRAGEAEYRCQARGLFRKEGLTPAVGDRVICGGGVIERILPRKNLLRRPYVANVDNLVIVLSAGAPRPDFALADKLIVQALRLSVRPVIAVNKIDDGRMEEEIARQYRSFGVERVSALRGDGIAGLARLLEGKISAMAGQSAVGKSSILNALCPSLALETGGLAKKTARGRHTTRASSLLYVEDIGGYLIDTPGFSVFEAPDMPPEALAAFYPEFAGCACRFSTCMHVSEPDCGVRAAVERGDIDGARYARYCDMVAELKERQDRKYD